MNEKGPIHVRIMTDAELIRAHWASFGRWMRLRAVAFKSKPMDRARNWGRVHAYAEHVLDPMALEMERRGIEIENPMVMKGDEEE